MKMMVLLMSNGLRGYAQANDSQSEYQLWIYSYTLIH